MESHYIHLTPEQADMFHKEHEPRILDPRTQKVYVAVAADEYERIKGMLEDADEQASWQILADHG
ncbi:MAG TPA: hypothetical protein VG433_03120, partial [Pirellulales bacterium]|nr:hypothetical protein [Pirellulales bacterium]